MMNFVLVGRSERKRHTRKGSRQTLTGWLPDVEHPDSPELEKELLLTPLGLVSLQQPRLPRTPAFTTAFPCSTGRPSQRS